MITLPENATRVEVNWTSYSKGWEAKVFGREGMALAYGKATEASTAEAAFAAAVANMEAERAKMRGRIDYAAAEFAPHFAEAAHA